MEKRTYKIEFKAEDRSVKGDAAVYGSWSQDLGWFREIIEPGAFTDAVMDSDIRALFNHDPNRLLARKKRGGSSQDTLTVEATERGLTYSFDMPSHGDDILEMIERGDLTQNSFAFKVAKDGDRWETDEAGNHFRYVTKVEELFDISPVTYPAYTSATIDTNAAKRSFDLYMKKEAEKEKIDTQEVKEETPTVGEDGTGEDYGLEMEDMRRYLKLRERYEFIY